MVTLWVFALLAVGGLGYWIRKSLGSSADKKRRESVREKSAARRLAQDRLDCRELEESLKVRLSSSVEPVVEATSPVRNA